MCDVTSHPCGCTAFWSTEATVGRKKNHNVIVNNWCKQTIGINPQKERNVTDDCTTDSCKWKRKNKTKKYITLQVCTCSFKYIFLTKIKVKYFLNQNRTNITFYTQVHRRKSEIKGDVTFKQTSNIQFHVRQNRNRIWIYTTLVFILSWAGLGF